MKYGILKYLLPLCLKEKTKDAIAFFGVGFGFALFLAGLTVCAHAQQQRPMTPTEMQGAVNAAIAQGNIARSMHIEAEAKLAGVTAELAAANAKIKELEAPKAETKPPQ